MIKIEQDVYPKTPNSTITIKGQKTNNRCVFQAILHYRETNEYYPCKMATYSDYNKAMCTDGNRHLLGEFIKSRLEKLGLLKVGVPISQNILLSYGAECIEIERFTDINKLIKDDLSNKVYLITF